MTNQVAVAEFYKRMNAHALDFSMTLGILFIECFALPSGLLQKLVVALTFYVFVVLIPLLNNGQTLGKKMFKLQPVIMGSEKKLTWWHLHLREILKYVIMFYSFGLTHVASFFMISERRDRRAVHDLLFKTHVIDLNYENIYRGRDTAAEDTYYNNYNRGKTIR
ncbi:MAG TPA: RDD family protein [Firmicutes bacterium]|nr:RDD family protein [Bacillota bacterium]